MRLITESEVADLLPMSECILAVEDSFRRLDSGAAINLPRRRIPVPEGFLHCMEAADLGIGRMGLKVYTSLRPRTRFAVLLFSTETGDMLAMIEADRLGQIRTGAATGVATRHMARTNARVLALFGAGRQAETQAAAIAQVRPLQRIQVYSRKQPRRRAFAERLSETLKLPVIPVSTPEEALDNADIVATATTSRVPVFDSALLRPGMHVNAVGANFLSRSELDAHAYGRGARVVTDSLEQARMEAGEIVAAVEMLKLRWEQVRELREVVSGRFPGRESEDEITIFKSLGIALEDIAAASVVYDRAVRQGIGRSVPFWEAV